MGKQWQTSFSWAPKSLWMVDCSHKIESYLLLGRKAITNLDSTLKSRDITCPTKVCIVKGMVFPVVMYGHESWTIRKAERRRLDAFELWCWRRLFESPFGLQRDQISQSQRKSTLNIHWKDWCYFGHLMWRTDSLQKPWCWERLKAGEVNDRGWDGWMVSPTWWTWVWVNSRSWWRTRKPRLLPSMRLQSARHDWAIELIHERKF